jgi:hypothetical protein
LFPLQWINEAFMNKIPGPSQHRNAIEPQLTLKAGNSYLITTEQFEMEPLLQNRSDAAKPQLPAPHPLLAKKINAHCRPNHIAL